ncbi:MarR family winged helix-turn-helix transcriptional regulator [Streptomyces sp. NPDC059597]|uniref:MarR family winged helix-turn-helix transcriptional regulator n=1 Tax=Streptomyces sp. NPDC059597 TaxID=3346879 RepID=UPI0036923718
MTSTDEPERREAMSELSRAAYSLSAADARLRGRATRSPGALSLTHARALRVLAERGPLSITELAEGVETTGPAATQLVNGLTKVGYVEREPDPANRRAVIVELTAKGRRRHEEREQVLAEALNRSLSHLDARDLATVADTLRRLGKIYDEL